MRVILILWFFPLFVFWGWYALSVNDINMGWFFLTRQFHDHLFNIYAAILHMPRDDVPLAIAGVFAFDSVLVLGLAALRWYKKWMPAEAAAVVDARLEMLRTKVAGFFSTLAFWRQPEKEHVYAYSDLSEERIARYLADYPRQPAE